MDTKRKHQPEDRDCVPSGRNKDTTKMLCLVDVSHLSKHHLEANVRWKHGIERVVGSKAGADEEQTGYGARGRCTRV